MFELCHCTEFFCLYDSRYFGISFFLLSFPSLIFHMPGTVSAPSPIKDARNTTLYCYTGPELLPSVKSILNDNTIAEDMLSPLSRVTLQVCFLYHCRIREVLNAKVSDVIHPDRVVLHGIKHSRSYVIYLPGLSSQLSTLTDAPGSTPLFPISYIKLYRDAVRVGIRFVTKGSKNSKRLHSSRYSFCQSLEVAVGDSVLSDLMRHKSPKSLQFYKS